MSQKEKPPRKILAEDTNLEGFRQVHYGLERIRFVWRSVTACRASRAWVIFQVHNKETWSIVASGREHGLPDLNWNNDRNSPDMNSKTHAAIRAAFADYFWNRGEPVHIAWQWARIVMGEEVWYAKQKRTERSQRAKWHKQLAKAVKSGRQSHWPEDRWQHEEWFAHLQETGFVRPEPFRPEPEGLPVRIPDCDP